MVRTCDVAAPERRQDAGADDARFARAARPDECDESTEVTGLVDATQQVGDDAFASGEAVRVAGAERSKTLVRVGEDAQASRCPQAWGPRRRRGERSRHRAADSAASKGRDSSPRLSRPAPPMRGLGGGPPADRVVRRGPARRGRRSCRHPTQPSGCRRRLPPVRCMAQQRHRSHRSHTETGQPSRRRNSRGTHCRCRRSRRCPV